MRQIALLLLVFSFAACDNKYHINLKTENVLSLKMHSKVKHSGIVIGEVSNMDVYGNSVMLKLAINRKFKIPKNSSFYLSTDLFGDGSINVVYSKSQSLFMNITDTAPLIKEIVIKTKEQKTQDSILWLNMKKLLELAISNIDTTVSRK